MRYRHAPFARQWHQFKRQADALNQAIADGTFAQWSRQKQERIKLKLIRSYHQLKVYFSTTMLKRALAGAAILLGLHTTGMAQDFAAPVQNPFNLAVDTTEYITDPHLVDMDGDGDLDILSVSYDYNYYGGFNYYENIGTPNAPAFGPQQRNPFNLSAPSNYLLFDTGDLDDDGDNDILGFEYYGQLYYFENVGTAQQPNFAAPVQSPFNFPGHPNSSDSLYLFTELADLDNDGDLDMMVGNVYGGHIRYYENTGTAASPSFPSGVGMPFNLPATIDSVYFTDIAVGDIDQDGDLDLLVSVHTYDTRLGVDVYENQFRYFENVGTPTNPDFSAPPVTNPFGLSGVGYILMLSDFADLDGDGDLDILSAANDTIGNGYYFDNYQSNFYYFENIAFPVGQEVQEAATLQLFPNPAQDQLYFTWPASATGTHQLDVFDAMGKVVWSEQVSPHSATTGIRIEHLPAGLYWLRLAQDGQHLSQQFIKQ